MGERVVIVGAGPAGYATALGLAALGVPCTIVEQLDHVAPGSRATGISRRALQLLTPSGVADSVMDVAVIQRGNQAFVGTTQLFLDRTPFEPGRFPRVVNIPQDLFERLVVERVAEHPGIEILWDHRVDGLRQKAAGVALDVTGPDGARTMDADWLVACDGARSTIRRAHGLRLAGVRFDTRFIVTDARIALDVEPGVRRIWFDPPSNPGGTVIMHQQPSDLWRIDFGLPPGEAEERAMEPDAIRARVGAHLGMFGVADDWELVWSGDYTASSVSLEDYRHGRVLFAGDAAHLVPIFGGRGMNSAIEDGFNLAWKLAAVIEGGCDDSLLDSYSAERRSGALQNSAKASIGAEVIAARSPGSLVLRRAALGLMLDGEHELQSLLSHRTTDANTYPASLLDGVASEPRGPAQAIGDGLVTPADGSARNLSDLLQPGFTVLDLGGAVDGADLPSSLLGLPLHHLRVDVLDGDEAGLAAPAAGDCVLLRPDRYVVAPLEGETIHDVLASAARLAAPSAAEGAAL